MLQSGGGAQVSTYLGDPSAAKRHCQLGAIAKNSLPVRVKVLCFDFSGQPANSKFVLAYAR